MALYSRVGIIDLTNVPDSNPQRNQHPILPSFFLFLFDLLVKFLLKYALSNIDRNLQPTSAVGE